MEITQALVRELFEYHEAGVLIWKKKPSTRIVIGNAAGTVRTGRDGKKRCQIKFNRKRCLRSRVVFLYYHGYLPDQVDHIDRNPLNDKIENLREASGTQNQGNRDKQKNNTSGFKGVYRNRANRWKAQIRQNSSVRYLGTFDSAEEAARAYDAAAREYFGEFAVLNFPN